MSLNDSEFRGVVDLSAVSDSLELPTYIAAVLALKAGAEAVDIRPGRVTADTSPGTKVMIRVSLVNIYSRAIASYKAAGWPVPERLYADEARWERENKGRM
ncbi:MAG: hypothetical protein WC551_00640 [Patescibacteria group bacterium]